VLLPSYSFRQSVALVMSNSVVKSDVHITNCLVVDMPIIVLNKDCAKAFSIYIEADPNFLVRLGTIDCILPHTVPDCTVDGTSAKHEPSHLVP
jgi:hypothetical protein